MAITVKFRRGSTAESNAFLGEEGELYIDKDKDTVVVHDGVTTGGFPLASEAWVTQAISNFGSSSFSGSYNDLTNKPTLFSGAYGDLTGLPTLFSGSYNDLTDKPTIPSLTGYATETYVNNQIVTKQAALVSGTNIKTINGTSLLGSGDITISGGGTALTISEIDGSNTITNQVSNVSAIRFDKDTGFNVEDLGSGEVKVSLGSSWKTWQVDGQSSLVAVGEDTVTFVAGTNMSIATDAIAKTITFSSSGGGSSTFSGDYNDLTNLPNLGIYALAEYLPDFATINMLNDYVSKTDLTAEVNQNISSSLAGYATLQYVIDQLVGVATQTYVNTQLFDINNQLPDFVTTSSLNNTLTNYITTNQASSYITTSNLGVELTNYGYLTSNSLDFILSNYNYVSYDELQSEFPLRLTNYITTANLQSQLNDYVTNTYLNTALTNYISTADLQSQLNDYVTNTYLNTALTNYISTADLQSQLNNYVTNTYLNTALTNYISTADLQSQLNNYVTNTYLTSVLSNYATVATSGSYNDLTDKPTIPSLTGYATESYVNTQVANLVETAPTTLDTLNELAAALGDDPNFATTISNQIGLKANSADLATVATSGSYNDLTNQPSIQPLNANLTTLSTNGFGVNANQVPQYDANAWLTIGANWKVKEDAVSGELIFAHNGVNRMKIDSSGNLTVTGDVTAFGTV